MTCRSRKILRCDKKSLTVSVSNETALVTKRILARNCSLSNRTVGCMRVKYLKGLRITGSSNEDALLTEHKECSGKVIFFMVFMDGISRKVLKSC